MPLTYYFNSIFYHPMQQFVVPQFIDVEDKIIGPITVRQFIILLSGFLLIGLEYKLFDFSLFIVSALFVFALTGIIAFLKINGRPFHYFILNLFQTLKRPKLRIWHFVTNDFAYEVEKKSFVTTAKTAPDKHYSASRLAELSLIVDTKGAYQGEGVESETMVERE